MVLSGSLDSAAVSRGTVTQGEIKTRKKGEKEVAGRTENDEGKGVH